MDWYHRPMRISAVQCNYGEDNFSILKNHVEKRGFNTEQLLHLFAKGHMAFYNEEEHGKKLDEYVKEAKRDGIRIITYLNVHCIDLDEPENKDGWIQKNSKDENIDAYNKYYLICVNNKDWFDYYEKNLKKLCEHHIDGIFLDGPLISPKGCYCKDCREKFFEKYNKSIFNCSYKEWLDFRVGTITEYIEKTNRIVKTVNKDIALYLNNESYYAGITGQDTKQLLPFVDIIGAEGGFSQAAKNQSLWYTSSRAKYIEMQAKGKPTVIFIAGDHKPNSYYMHTPEETELMMAQTVSNGANIWYGIHAPTYIMDCPGGKAAERFMKFLENNDEYFTKSSPYSKVALMWSVDSSNYYRSSVGETDFTDEQRSGNNVGYGDLNKAFMGVYEMLSRQHVQFDVIDEDNIHSGSYSKYELIILASSGCMSESIAGKIREYVYKGGNVICFFDCSFFDHEGEKKLKPSLADLLGIEKVGNVVNYESGGCGYIYVKEETLNNGLSACVLPSPGHVYDITPSQDSEVLAYSNEPMQSRYIALPKEKYPVILKNKYGSGLCYYLNGTFGEYFTEKSNPDHCMLINKIISGLTKPILITDTPGSVEMIIREQRENDRLLLHITNMTGEMTRPINRIIPLYNTNVSILVEKQIIAVRNIVLGTQIPFKIFNGRVEFVIEEINQYELYSIDFERC